MILGLAIREADGVLLWNGIPIEARNVVWQGMPVACVVARLDPIDGPTWRVDHAIGDLAEKIKTLGAVDQRLEQMWSLPERPHDLPNPDSRSSPRPF